MDRRYAALDLVESERTPLPLDEPTVGRRIVERTPFASALQRHLRELREQGWTLLRQVHDRRLVDGAVADYYRFVDEHGLDEPDKRKRIYFLEQSSDHLKEILLAPRVLDVLDAAFRAEAVLYGTQIFECGSQQGTHRDSPFFHTRPFGHFFGVWHALEDVHPKAGPLEYFPGGHLLEATPVRRWSADAFRELAPGAPEQPVYDRLLRRFNVATLDDCRARGLAPRRLVVERGDVLIWHPWLPHGGTPIDEPGRTRLSIVGHYVPIDVPVFNVDVFFARTNPATAQRELAYQPWNGRQHVNQGPAFVPVSYLPEK